MSWSRWCQLGIGDPGNREDAGVIDGHASLLVQRIRTDPGTAVDGKADLTPVSDHFEHLHLAIDRNRSNSVKAFGGLRVDADGFHHGVFCWLCFLGHCGFRVVRIRFHVGFRDPACGTGWRFDLLPVAKGCAKALEFGALVHKAVGGEDDARTCVHAQFVRKHRARAVQMLGGNPGLGGGRQTDFQPAIAVGHHLNSVSLLEFGDALPLATGLGADI